MKNHDLPAMPIYTSDGIVSSVEGAVIGDGMGLSKREWIASSQMAALQSSLGSMITDAAGIKHLAKIAVAQADALLFELENNNGEVAL